MFAGALVWAAFGLGRDDSSGFFIYLLANAMLYGVVFAALLLAAIPRTRES